MTTSKEKFETKKLPMMPIRDVVIFPFMMTPFVVGRESSVRALEEALAADKKIFLATQHDASIDEPKSNEIYQVGTIVNIVQSLKLPDGNIKVLVEGIERGRLLQATDSDGYMQASVRVARYPVEMNPQIEAGMQRVTTLFEQYVKLCQALNYETMISAVRMEDPAKLTDIISANLQLSIEEKQELLEIFDPSERLNRIADVLDVEIEKLNVDRTIQSRVKRQMEKAQKEYYLNEKIKAIQKELGRGEKSEFDELKKKSRSRRHAERSKGQGAAGTEEAGSHAAHVGGIDGFAQLSRLAAGRAVEEALQGNSQYLARRKSSQRRSLRAGKDQGTHPRIPRGAPVGEESQGLDSLLRWTSGRGQDFSGHVDRQGHRTQVRPHVAWRSAR